MSESASPSVKIKVGGNEVEDSDFQSYVVDLDMFQPDMASVVLSNQADKFTGGESTVEIGGELEVGVGSGTTPIFKGEVVAIEPIYKGGEKSKVLIRGMSKLHRMLRARKSKTYSEMSDKDIMSQVISAAGMSAKWEADISIKYKHVYQHNQTDLEFLRVRAARIGVHLWCVGNEVFIQKPKLDQAPVLELKVDESGSGTLRSFNPRMSAASIVKKVVVKGWNPEKKELITGEAQPEGSKLGSKKAQDSVGELAGAETFTVDHPIWSKEEADILAKARMRELSLGFITGEAIASGDAKYQLGKTVKIVANAMKQDDRFNGNYYIMGVTHRHMGNKKENGGALSILKLARDMAGPG